MKTIEKTYLQISDTLGDDSNFVIECQPTTGGIDLTFTIGQGPNIFQFTEELKGTAAETELVKLQAAIARVLKTYKGEE